MVRWCSGRNSGVDGTSTVYPSHILWTVCRHVRKNVQQVLPVLLCSLIVPDGIYNGIFHTSSKSGKKYTFVSVMCLFNGSMHNA